jgi:hypothetical protein
MITPYTCAHEFETETAKMEKVSVASKTTVANPEVPEVDATVLKQALPSKAPSLQAGGQAKAEILTVVDLSELKYDI